MEKTIEEILSVAIDVRAPYAQHMIMELETLIEAETKRCNDIVQAARNGDIDQDWRSVASRINSGSKMIYENGTYRDAE